jgi:DNA-binding MarR family transcriptional regulator
VLRTSAGTDHIAEARRQWETHWGTEPTPSMAMATSVMRVQQILLARLNELLKPLDLTFPRYEALMLLYLSRRGSLPLGKMGVRLQVHRTSVTNLIDGLERSGLAERVPHDTDRRTTLASITPKGREAAARATEILNEERFGTEPLSTEELEQVTAILRHVRAHADDFPDD